VEPDDPVAIEKGVKTMIGSPPSPNWARYKADHSWTRNGELVVEAMIRSERGP
jgi:hypothetical protein